MTEADTDRHRLGPCLQVEATKLVIQVQPVLVPPGWEHIMAERWDYQTLTF